MIECLFGMHHDLHVYCSKCFIWMQLIIENCLYELAFSRIHDLCIVDVNFLNILGDILS